MAISEKNPSASHHFYVSYHFQLPLSFLKLFVTNFTPPPLYLPPLLTQGLGNSSQLLMILLLRWICITL